MFLTRISVAHPVFATMMMAAILVIGLFGFSRMAVDEFPEIDLPVVVVSTTYTGAAPETIESNVTRDIEEAVNTIGGVSAVTSESFEGRSLVIVEFNLDVDSRGAAQEVRDRVSALEAGFPDEVDTPQITRFNPDDAPILSIAVSSPTRSLADITTIADQIITQRLNVVSGVGQTTIVGGSERQVLVMVDPERLEALGLSTAQVLDAIRLQNQDRAAGTITSGNDQRIVTVEGRLAEITDFDSIIVARDGIYPVYLSDVATIIDGSAELTSAATRNGVPALGVDIVKVQGANTVGLAEDLRAEIAVTIRGRSRPRSRTSRR